jgi:hypothetical protein
VVADAQQVSLIGLHGHRLKGPYLFSKQDRKLFKTRKIARFDDVVWVTMASKQVTMRRNCKIAEVTLVTLSLVLWLCTSAKPLYAYADPGTGLMAIQILGATIAGFLFFIRKRIVELFARIRKMTGKGRR